MSFNRFSFTLHFLEKIVRLIIFRGSVFERCKAVNLFCIELVKKLNKIYC